MLPNYCFFFILYPYYQDGQTKGPKSMKSLVSAVTATLVVLFFLFWIFLAAVGSRSTPAWLESALAGVLKQSRPSAPKRILAFSQERSSGDLTRLAREAAECYDLEPALLLAMIKVSSDFNLYARDLRGRAGGLLLLRWDVARDYSVTDVFDPGQNIRGGATCLRALLYEFPEDPDRALLIFRFGRENSVPARSKKEFLTEVRYWWARYRVQEKERQENLVLRKD